VFGNVFRSPGRYVNNIKNYNGQQTNKAVCVSRRFSFPSQKRTAPFRNNTYFYNIYIYLLLFGLVSRIYDEPPIRASTGGPPKTPSDGRQSRTDINYRAPSRTPAGRVGRTRRRKRRNTILFIVRGDVVRLRSDTLRLFFYEARLSQLVKTFERPLERDNVENYIVRYLHGDAVATNPPGRPMTIISCYSPCTISSSFSTR